MFSMLASSIKGLLHLISLQLIIKLYFYSDNGTDYSGLHTTPPSTLPITVGVVVGTCVVLTLGVVIFIFISRCVQ